MEIEAREMLILSMVPGIGPSRLRALINHFDGTREVFSASARKLSCVELLDRKTVLSLLSFLGSDQLRSAQQQADAQLSKLNRLNARILTLWDDTYPTNLKRLYDPPPFLFIRGNLLPEDEVSIAVVGTRTPSPYGARLATRFARELAENGFSVISGLARGVDTLAHDAALRADGRTVAVIGSGLDVLYPRENTGLSERIIRRGAVISEFLMGSQPDAVNFPRRNRIISGLSLGTLVIETGIEGGAMITASFALEQNREVFALPGPLGGPRPSGTHQMIKEGRAKLTESVEDIIAELHPSLQRKRAAAASEEPPGPPRTGLTLFEQKIMDAIGTSTLHIDAIALAAGIPTNQTLVELLGLELKGVVCQLPGKMFRMA
jgi:DNA processing protein